MATALVNGRVLVDGGLAEGLAVVLEGPRIAAVVGDADPRAGAASRHDLEGGLLLPGFIDVQVNGGGGLLFNDSRDVETIRRIGAAHRKFGTTGFLPTLISDDLQVVEEAMRAVDAAIEAGVPGVLGIHVEGPFLSVARKGVHDPSWFRELDESGIRLLTSLRHGKTLVTLAPEMTTPGFIDKLAAAGVIVCAGHTDASYEEIREALRHGLSGFTHLFNAMSQLTSRRPGAVGAALEDEESWCGIIVDGQHVDPAVLRLALRCKRRDRFMLVTDAMPSVGTDRKNFTLQGRSISVDGAACVDENGNLAGSDTDMASAIRNSMSMLRVSLPEAVAMASTHPSAFLGLAGEAGRIAPGLRANLVLADDRLSVRETWIDGRPTGGLSPP
jgi:N-acetylglucosamine-6-phosphate deacetylase